MRSDLLISNVFVIEDQGCIVLGDQVDRGSLTMDHGGIEKK